MSVELIDGCLNSGIASSKVTRRQKRDVTCTFMQGHIILILQAARRAAGPLTELETLPRSRLLCQGIPPRFPNIAAAAVTSRFTPPRHHPRRPPPRRVPRRLPGNTPTHYATSILPIPSGGTSHGLSRDYTPALIPERRYWNRRVSRSEWEDCTVIARPDRTAGTAFAE